MKKEYSVWIETEEWENGWDRYDDNSDVILEFEDGSRWVASFYTYKNIATLVEKNKRTGECLNGKYFWSSDMILVDELSRSRIEEVIADLINENELGSTFKRIEDTFS